MRDHLIGGVQNVSGGSVVLLQLDHHCIRIILFKIQYVADVRAAPAVDGLIVVAHHAQIAFIARHQPHKLILRRIRILIFVHQHIIEPVLIVFQYRRMLTQQHQRFDQQIIEIQRVIAAQRILIFDERFIEFAVAEIIARILKPFLRREQPILRIRNHRPNRLGREFLIA